ncbi:hypothetical protein GCM10011395_11150 [Sphingomonas psychrolutea]|uniref:Uncharacterized protein n=1 Tax=Sphingomonas psychrolutea TaxID=1259676 RepID=A0ABQ1GFI7_9SPHN|nr:hypothetical protein GCM10011395_11150 [Sphingomonas psychrolutea]
MVGRHIGEIDFRHNGIVYADLFGRKSRPDPARALVRRNQNRANAEQDVARLYAGARLSRCCLRVDGGGDKQAGGKCNGDLHGQIPLVVRAGA